ncbi:MAG: HD domain-containing phosphohydrolase [bacterium]
MVEFRKAIKKDAPAASADPSRAAGAGGDFNFSSQTLLRRPAKDRTAQSLYLEGLALAAAVIEWAAGPQTSDFPLSKPLEILVKDVCDWLDSEQSSRLLCLSRSSSEPLYLPAHSLNVCILTSYLAIRSGVPHDQVLSLSQVSLLHDIGMAGLSQYWDNSQILTPEQLAPIKNHPLETLKLIDRIGCCDDPGMALAAVDHHERVDGSGYPNSKLAGQISASAHLLAVADTFTSMTHIRKFRKAIKPFDAVRAISHLSGHKLQMEAVRKFLQIMSIYPIGSGVRLNNGVVAKVIAANEKQLTKPVVQIVTGAGEYVEIDQIIDLQKERLLFIREPVCLGPLDSSFNIG